jgi:hypothetical protein
MPGRMKLPAALALLCCSAILVAPGCGSDDDGGGEPEHATENTHPQVGPTGTVDVDNVLYTVKSARKTAKVGASNAKGQFVVVRLRAHNEKADPANLSARTITLEAPKGRVHPPDKQASTAAAGGKSPIFLKSVPAGKTSSGVVVFDVPGAALSQNPRLRLSELGTTGKLTLYGYIELPSL